MLVLMRKQLFPDGNKRTAMLAANRVMISAGCGVLSVPIEQQSSFTTKLLDFYESGELEPMKAFVYDHCIDGLMFEPVIGTEHTRESKDKSYPFHIAGSSKKVYVCESPIDAMSQVSLAKLNGQDWTANHYISLGCLSDQALERFLGMNETTEIVFCLDNDEYATYHDGSPAPNWGQAAAFSFAQKYTSLGYETSVETPQSKDINEDLQVLRRMTEEARPFAEKAEYGYER
ncbi:toprim domain-containing protein [Paenibacillus sp. S150]|uniref:toprim domain-containing protein n=1 Tax=Paenibacillus sp. S150 TaxID=2749826 RepID=UPI002107C6AA|nr:toprim domain-containing protein [Paenibacillus sp. S150]